MGWPLGVGAASVTPSVLHVLSVLVLWLVLLDAELLEENIGRVEYGAGVSSVGTLLPTECSEHTGLKPRWFGRVNLSLEVAKELGLRDTISSQVRADLLADFGTAVIYLNLVVFLSCRRLVTSI